MGKYPERIRDPIHGFIHFSKREAEIIDHPLFQRLRDIKQLGLTYYIYPGATHTRLEHSLGVMEFVTQAFERLRSKYPGMLKKKCKAVGYTVDQATDILRLSALLHDIGHLPFSHAGEAVLPEDKTHEHVSIALINDSELTRIIDSQYSLDVRKLVISILSDEIAILPEFLILERLLKGVVDLDRTDYLLRDSHHCGVYYGHFDFHRLLETLEITETPEGLDLAIESGGLHCLEALLVARYFMFAQVYFHRTRRIYDYYVKKYLEIFFEGQSLGDDLTQVARFDDVTLTDDIRRNALTQTDSEKYGLASRIYYRRNHHRLIWETSDHATYDDQETAQEIQYDLEKRFSSLDIYGDYKAKGFIHQISLDDEDDAVHDLKVIKRRGSPKWIRHESGLIRNIPKSFRVIRIYGYGDKDILRKARGRAKKIAGR